MSRSLKLLYFFQISFNFCIPGSGSSILPSCYWCMCAHFLCFHAVLRNAFGNSWTWDAHGVTNPCKCPKNIFSVSNWWRRFIRLSHSTLFGHIECIFFSEFLFVDLDFRAISSILRRSNITPLHSQSQRSVSDHRTITNRRWCIAIDQTMNVWVDKSFDVPFSSFSISIPPPIVS